jgi:cytochrome P450
MPSVERPPGPHINFPLAIVAQMMPRFFPFDPLAWGLDVARQYGDIAHYQLGPLHVYQVTHPDMVRQILVEQADKFHKPRLLKGAFRPFAGDGLLTSDGARWKQQRKLMQPAFHHAQLAIYGDYMVTRSLQAIDEFDDERVVDVQEEMTRLTLAIVVKCLFSADVSRDATEVGRLMSAVLDAANHRLNSAFQLPSWMPTARNLREKRALARLDEILAAVIAARRVSSDASNDLLSMLLAAFDEDSGARMSDRQLRDEMMTLFLAGHETTATALTWAWYLVSQHPEVEARLLGELDRVLQGRPPTAADLPNMPYTEMVVREVMRLYPPAPGVAREPIEDVRIGNFTVPKGSLITVNTYALHRDPRFFEDPERFDPERFARGWEERIPRYAYLPFGGGPRVCIGNGFATMEARLILATVAQRRQLTLEPRQDIVAMQLVTVRPRNGIRMRLKQRR